MLIVHILELPYFTPDEKDVFKVDQSPKMIVSFSD